MAALCLLLLLIEIFVLPSCFFADMFLEANYISSHFFYLDKQSKVFWFSTQSSSFLLIILAAHFLYMFQFV